MIFHRVLHDGLHGVIHRGPKKAKIVFNKGLYETTIQEECDYLIGLGYAHDGNMPGGYKIESFDYAVRKLDDGGGFAGKALRVFPERSKAEDYILEMDLDLEKYGIEKRPS